MCQPQVWEEAGDLKGDAPCFVFLCFFKLVSLSNVSLKWFHLNENSWPTKKEHSAFLEALCYEVVDADVMLM